MFASVLLYWWLLRCLLQYFYTDDCWDVCFSITILMIVEMSLLSPSTTRRNKLSERGHPCRIPIDKLKKEQHAWLIKITKFTEETHTMIQFVISRGRPIWSRRRQTKVQYTLSYAFINSSLRTKSFILLDLIVWKPSWATSMVVRIRVLYKKPNYSLETHFDIAYLILENDFGNRLINKIATWNGSEVIRG